MNIAKLLDKIQQRWRYRHLPQSLNIDDVAYRLAAEDSARYVIANMKSVPNYDWDLDLHKAIAGQLQPGHVLEFGVASGRTVRHLAGCLPRRTIHGFDSFEGLPETWSWLFPAGSFAQSKPRVPGNVKLHCGWFDATVPVWTRDNPGPIALLHIDCDLYSSTQFVLDQLHSQIVPGTYIIFDEYLNHLGWQDDEFRAWHEYVAKHNVKYQYVGRVGCHQQVAIRVCE